MARSKIRKEKKQMEGYRTVKERTNIIDPDQEVAFKDHIGAKRPSSVEPIFVIKKHKARTSHYDFRLEIDGVLKSWVIPKGPSMNPSVKRLAVPGEDQKLEYAEFEGVIPEGQYGAGAVMVWDIGTYLNIKRDKRGKIMPMEKSYKEGHIEVYLEGEKLYGDFALIRTAQKKDGAYKWSLIKIKDDYASTSRNPVARRTKSAITDRSLTQIKKDAEDK